MGCSESKDQPQAAMCPNHFNIADGQIPHESNDALTCRRHSSLDLILCTCTNTEVSIKPPSAPCARPSQYLQNMTPPLNLYGAKKLTGSLFTMCINLFDARHFPHESERPAPKSKLACGATITNGNNITATYLPSPWAQASGKATQKTPKRPKINNIKATQLNCPV